MDYFNKTLFNVIYVVSVSISPSQQYQCIQTCCCFTWEGILEASNLLGPLALKHMIIRWTTEEPHKTEWRPSRGNKRDEEKEWKGGRMAYCLAVWCPHSAVSCPLVAVDDSLNSPFTPPPAREWRVPTPRLVPPSKDPLTPLLTIWMPGTNNKGCPPVIRGCREKEEKLKTRRSHQILRGL